MPRRAICTARTRLPGGAVIRSATSARTMTRGPRLLWDGRGHYMLNALRIEFAVAALPSRLGMPSISSMERSSE
jgi:hypothetical protein